MNIEPKSVNINCKAEIASVELNFKNKETVCITLCYRVGTLGVPNFHEIEKHLRLIGQKKKSVKHVVVGDFNFGKTAGSEWQSSDNIERLFLDLFGDLGLDKL